MDTLDYTPSAEQNQSASSQKCRKCKCDLPDGAVFCPKCGQKQSLSQRPKSRGNGQGTAYKRGSSWVCVKTIGYHTSSDGSVKRKTVSKGGFKTKKEALAYLPQLEYKPKRAKLLSFSQLYDLWEPTHRAGKSTMDCYRAAYKYFRPVWYQPFADIDIDDLQECMDECEKGKRTKENMKALCGLMYKYAIPRHLASLNLAQYLIVGGGEVGERRGIPLEDLHLLENAMGSVPYADYVVAQCYLGFRPSELLSLDASKYDRAGRYFIGGAKTDAGKDRRVPVSPKIQPIIDRLVRDKLAGPVFCGPDGQSLSISEYRNLFYTALERAGIENPIEGTGDMRRHRYTPHSCRHTFATMLKNAAGSDKDKLALIGHTSTEMLRHYQDVDLENLRKIVNNF